MSPMVKATVPVRPIRRLLQEYADEYGLKTEALASIIAPDPDAPSAIAYARRLRAIMTTQEMMTFDIADRILCRLGRPELWWTDPELAAVYEESVKHVSARVATIARVDTSARPESEERDAARAS